MKKLLIGLGALVAVVIVAVIAIPFLIPLETYKAEISAEVKKATGRDLAIKGDIKFSLLPSLELEVNDVAFANAPGATPKDMVKLAKLQFKLKMLPLLSGEVAIDSFVLVDPVIRLAVDKKGRPNWVFAGGPATPAAPTQKGEGGGGGPGLSELRLGDIRLVNGLVTYTDAKSGTAQELSQINMRLSLPDLASPLSGQGKVTWRGKTISLKLAVAKPRALMEGKTSKVSVDLTSEPVKLAYNGAVTNAKPARITGDIDLNVPSLRKLAAWTGNPLQTPGGGLEGLAITGKLAVTGSKVTFTKARFTLDAIKASGDFLIDGGKKRPYLKGTLNVARLDLNPYLPPEKRATKAKPSPASPTAKVAGEWSDEPIDLSGLGKADADFALSVASIRLRKIEIGKSVVKVRLKRGKLTTDLAELKLYDGQGKGRVVLDGSGRVPALTLSFNMSGIQAEPLLRDAIDMDRLSGRGSTNIRVAGRGRSQRQLVGNLNGKGAINFKNGAIKGINLGAMVRNVSSAFLDPKARESQKTDFSELTGTYTITKGIVRNTDLSMLSPLIRVTGSGRVDLPKRTVNYRIEPKVVMTSQGQGGSAKASGIMVPVVVSGPWHDLSYKPDLGALVKQQLGDPSKALGAVKGLLGKPSGTTTTPIGGTATGPTSPLTKPLEGLKGIFGR